MLQYYTPVWYIAPMTRHRPRPDPGAPLPPGPHGHPHRDIVLRRLNRAHGQLAGIIQMVERDAPCRDVLTQIAAVRGAVHKAATLLLRDHLKSCVADAYATGEGEAAADELVALLNAFGK